MKIGKIKIVSLSVIIILLFTLVLIYADNTDKSKAKTNQTIEHKCDSKDTSGEHSKKCIETSEIEFHDNEANIDHEVGECFEKCKSEGAGDEVEKSTGHVHDDDSPKHHQCKKH